jgi:hypothetical protein
VAIGNVGRFGDRYGGYVRAEVPKRRAKQDMTKWLKVDLRHVPWRIEDGNTGRHRRGFGGQRDMWSNSARK